MRALVTAALVLALAVPARGEGLVLNFRDAEISAVVAAVARATGRRFVHDAELRGRVTVVLEDEISEDEALEVLNAALLMVGYATIPGPDGVWKILPIEAGRGAAPWLYGEASSESSRLVTTLVRLDAAKPDEIAEVLGRESRAAIVLPYPPTNGLIIAAPEDRLAAMLVLVRALDKASKVELRVFPLRWADAATLATQIEEAFQPGVAPELPFRIVVDERTNSLLVQGAPARIAEVKTLIETLDAPARSTSGLHVVRVVNAEAKTLAEHLLGLGLGEESAAGSPAANLEIAVDEATNSLVIRANRELFAQISAVIGELDRIPARIGIEVHVWDVETARGLELGFDALLPLVHIEDLDDTIAFTAIGDVESLLSTPEVVPFLARFTRTPLLIPIIGPDGLPTVAVVPTGGAQITAAEGDVSIRALTSPYLLAVAGEEQRIFSGDQVPIPVSSAASDSTDSFFTEVAIQREDVGVDLAITPTAVSDESVGLELHVEVSSVAESLSLVSEAETGSATGDQGPTLRKFKVDANIRMTHGAVMLVAAAPADVSTSSDEGVPYLSDIPILGWFFRSTREIDRTRRLVAAVQVHPIQTPEDQRAESTMRRLAFERQVQRVGPLASLSSAPYAVLVATRATRGEADRVVEELRGLPGVPALVPWQGDGSERWDVYLIGFEQISELGPVTAELRARGFSTRLEVASLPRW
jgi:general secretion pathway protein D